MLTASAPPSPPRGEPTALSAALAREVVASDRGVQGRIRGLRRRHKVATAVTAAAIVLIPTSAFAAPHFLARTGTFGNPAVSGGAIPTRAPSIAAARGDIATAGTPRG